MKLYVCLLLDNETSRIIKEFNMRGKDIKNIKDVKEKLKEEDSEGGYWKIRLARDDDFDYCENMY